MGIFDKVTIAFGNAASTDKSKNTPRHDAAEISKQPDKAGIVSKPISMGMEQNPRTGLTAPQQETPAAKSTGPLGDGTTIHTYEDGSSVISDAKGHIVRTIDVLGVKREFLRDRYTGQLMIKRFGLWNKPASATLDADGTLSYTADGVDIVEQLDGTHMHRHHDTNITIITDHVKKVEIVKNPDGQITKRQTNSDGETFGIWRDLELTFLSETFYQPRRHEALTPNGAQPLVYVSRAERRILEPNIMQEKFFFRNPNKNERQVTLSLQFGSGLLMLKSVISVASIIHGEAATETTFEMKQPVTLRVDLPGYRGAIDNVINVRLFDATSSVGVAFISSDKKEHVVLVPKAAAAFPHMPNDGPVSRLERPITSSQMPVSGAGNPALAGK
jgi:hypothetical protein